MAKCPATEQHHSTRPGTELQLLDPGAQALSTASDTGMITAHRACCLCSFSTLLLLCNSSQYSLLRIIVDRVLTRQMR